MKKYRGIAIVLIAIIVMLTLVGCGDDNKSTEVNLNGEIPESLTIFSGMAPNILAAGGTTFNDCLTFQLLEEKTGCHVEWQHPATGAQSERFNIMMVSGEYPDAIVYNWNNATGGARTYAEDGVIVELTPYIETCMPNFSKILEDNPEFKRAVVTDDGKIYTIPYIRLDQKLCVYIGPVMRTDWLENLGLSIPKNADELYTVLKAFKEQDPNENGKADEIPMGGVGFDSVQGIGPLLWAFGANYDFQIKDGKVLYGPMTEEFKQGLAYIAKLYSEKLIDPDYLLDTRAKLDAKFIADTTGFKFGFQPTTYYGSMNDGRKVSGVPYLVAADGENYCFNPSYIQPVKTETALAISTANKNVAGTLKWLDTLYSEEGLRYANYGREGETYTVVNGEEIFTDKVLKPDNGKTSAQMIALTSIVRDSAFPTGQKWQYYKQTLEPWGIEAVETWIADDVNTEGILPQVTMTAEENERYSEIMNAVKTYMQEEANKIITGRGSIENWSSVTERMKNMGIEEAIDIQNAAYQRYIKR